MFQNAYAKIHLHLIWSINPILIILFWKFYPRNFEKLILNSRTSNPEITFTNNKIIILKIMEVKLEIMECMKKKSQWTLKKSHLTPIWFLKEKKSYKQDKFFINPES